MAILGNQESRIEVRLQKVPVTNNDSPSYFEEHAPIGRKDNLTKAVTRYILPENCTYTIVITLKKGFEYRDGGLAVRLWDQNTKLFHERTLINSHGRGGKKVLDSEKTYYVRFIPQEGQENNSPNTFYVLRFDEPPVEAVSVSGLVVKVIEKLKVELVRYNKPRPERKVDTGPDEADFQRNLKSYESLRKTLRSDVQAQDQSGNAPDIGRERQVNFGGVTPATRLIGSTEAGSLLKPPERYYTSGDIERLKFKFIRCTNNFIAEKNLAKTPISQEFLPWDSDNDAERKACFKILQDVDKKNTEEQKYAQAGASTQDEKNKIYKELFNVGFPPNRWRPYDNLYARERQILFEELQTRRKFFERSEYPPEPVMAEFSPNTPPSNRSASNAAPSSTASTVRSATRPPTSAVPSRLSSLKLDSSNSTSTTSAVSPSPRVASNERSAVDTTPTRNPKPSTPVIFIADDDDDPDNDPDDDLPLFLRRASLGSMTYSPIKSEPMETTSEGSIIDVDATTHQTPKRSIASSSSCNAGASSASKRVKLEPGISSPQTPAVDDVELRRLKEQLERDEEELRQEERVRALIRSRNEKKARIAEMEAKKGV